MATEQAEKMKVVVSAFHPVLKESGFRKYRYTFNRQASADVVHVIHFWQGPYDPPAWTEIPGLRESVYGLFSVNYGVFVQGAWHIQQNVDAGETKNKVNEYDCHIRRRLRGADNAEPKDWWSLDDESAIPRVDGMLKRVVLPWFEGFETSEQILTQLEVQPPRSREVGGIGTPSDGLLAVYVRLGRGEREAAQEALDRYATAIATRVPQPGHVAFVSALAERNHLRFQTPPLD